LKHPHGKYLLLGNAVLTGAFVGALSLADSAPSYAHSHRGSIHSSGPHGVVGRSQSRNGSGGMASVYSGGGTASGERMNPGAMTAAHRTLPFGTRVTVTNSHTGSSVVVRINDRGPFVHGRVIDLSPAAARAIGVSGVSPVSLRVGG
jgi:rare lipoprotein A